ncbi:M13 family metallopeptidase [Streptococcus suis]|uniref:M13 family metallopeptidase n=4 Tax=Streptococcus suis TaxID=1307 RepID=UPI000CF4F3EA|nr:M13 family metallopeptidase [Streptococcus suis]MCL4880803.1 M13 family metallopeptidase [Streptococcus suis]
MIKRMFCILVPLVLSIILFACDFINVNTPNEYSTSDIDTIQSNYYKAVNSEWLNGTWTSSLTPLYNEFTRIQIEINEQLQSDFEKMASGDIEPDTEDMKEFIKLYQKAFDFSIRNSESVSASRKILNEITTINSFRELANISKDWVLKEYALPFDVEIISNPKNTSEKLIMLTPPKTILPDRSYYDDENKKEKLLDSYRMSVTYILENHGFSTEDAKKLAESAIRFDSQVFPFLMETEDLHNSWGPIDEKRLKDFAEIDNYSSILSLKKNLYDLVGSQPNKVYISNPSYFEHLDLIIQEDNFSDYKAWAMVNQVMKLAPYLSSEIIQSAGSFTADVQGQGAALPSEYVTYLELTDIFSESISSYYGRHYSDSTSIQAAHEMTQSIVETYKNRIRNISWLSEVTKQFAIKKLDNIVFHIGYQKSVSDYTKLIKIDLTKSYIENILDIKFQNRKLSFELFNESIDRTVWSPSVSSSDVTANYSPYQNAIYIPAAILKAPFYDKNQSLAENYGGLGKIIAHEITHALDSTGANFDETGSLKDWWTPQDRENFEKLTQKVRDMFEGLEVYGGKVNGQLTLSENIADLGGIQIALETLKREDKSANLQEFFEHYAMSRREQVSTDFGKRSLINESHAPEEFRVNIQIQQISDFYQIYDIPIDAPMYREPVERVQIW